MEFETGHIIALASIVLGFALGVITAEPNRGLVRYEYAAVVVAAAIALTIAFGFGALFANAVFGLLVFTALATGVAVLLGRYTHYRAVDIGHHPAAAMAFLLGPVALYFLFAPGRQTVGGETEGAELPYGAWDTTYRVICGLIFFFLVAPIVVIIPLSFNATPYFTFTREMLTFDPAGYSLRWYDALFSSSEWMNSVANSFFIAISSAVIATTLGTLAALGLARREMPARAAITAFLISPMIVPLIITAAALFSFYARINLSQTYLSIILSHVVLGTPFVVITVTAALAGFDNTLIRASQSLGANQVTTFFKVIMPLLLPGIIAGALFAFITSLDEVVVVLFLAGPEQTPMTVRMFSGLREEISPTILALASILVALSILLLSTLEMVRRNSERQRTGG